MTTNITINTGGWFVESTATADEEEVPFMLAQGYEITGKTTAMRPVPGVFTTSTSSSGSIFQGGSLSFNQTQVMEEYSIYTLKKKSLQPDAVVQSMMEALTAAHNSGREANEQRYNEIIAGMTGARADSGAASSAVISDADVGGAISTVVTRLSQITDNQPSLSEFTNAFQELNAAIDDFDGEGSDAIAVYLTTLGKFTVGLPTLSEFNEIVSKLDSGVDQFDAGIDFSSYFADLAELSQDRPQLADFTSGLTELSNRLTAFDARVESLRSSYDANSQDVQGAISDALTAVQSAVGRYRTEATALKSKQSSVEGAISTILSGDSASIAAHASVINANLSQLETIYQSQNALANTAVSQAESAIATLSTVSNGLLASMEASQVSHEAAMNAILAETSTSFSGQTASLLSTLATMRADYTSHVSTATGFLTGLGVTETARINEQFNNSKSQANQSLADRGFYSSALTTQVEAQVERERAEALVTLNDRLNREKWENQHRLFEQQQAMRDKHIGVYTGLQALEQQVLRNKTEVLAGMNTRSIQMREISLTARQRIESIRLDLTRVDTAIRQAFAQIAQEAKAESLRNLDRVQAARTAVSSLGIQGRDRIFGHAADAAGRAMAGEEAFGRIEASLREAQQSVLTRLKELEQGWADTEGRLLQTGIEGRARVASISAEVRQSFYDVLLRHKLGKIQGRLGGIQTQADVMSAKLQSTGVAAQVSADVKRVYYDLILRHKIAAADGHGSRASVIVDKARAALQARTAAATTESEIVTAYYDLLLRQAATAGSTLVQAASVKGELMFQSVNQANDLAVAMYGFVERREDAYPGVGSMAQLAASIGAS